MQAVPQWTPCVGRCPGSVSYTHLDVYKRQERAAAELNGRRVNVGVYGEQAWLAGIHEYGCKIKVTDKMRAYLHSQGLHLKDSTEYITIPERAFLRNGYDFCLLYTSNI